MSGKRGFLCALCGGEGGVIDVREAPRDNEMQIRRRYACASCENRWSTLERCEGILPRGRHSEIAVLSAADKLHIDKLVASRIQQIAARLRRGRVE